MLEPELPLAIAPAQIPFLQAKHFSRLQGPRQVDWLVIHSAEVGEELDGAEALLRKCAAGETGPDGQPRVASWHYAVDADSVTQSVLEEDVAFHAPGANSRGIGIELCGRARQTLDEWQDAYSIKTLELAAWLAAKVCARWQIPAVFQDAAGLMAGCRGVTTHAQVSKAFKKSDHWDPGPWFPMEHFLNRVAWWYTAGIPASRG